MHDYYEVLGIEKEASEEEITQAYRNLAKQYHPDKFPENSNLNVLKGKTDLSEVERDQLIQLKEKAKEYEERFKKIKEAYTVLSNPEKREMYDQEKKNNQYSSSIDDWDTKWNKEWNINFQKSNENWFREKKRMDREIEGRVTSYSNLEEWYSKQESRSALKQESLKRVLDAWKDALKEGDLETSSHILYIHLIPNNPEKFSAWIKDINFSNCSECIEAYIILYDKENFLNPLIEKGVKLSSTFLYEAIECRATKVVYYLSNEYIDKIDINYQNENGNTALHLALECLPLYNPKVEDIVKSFLSKGAKLDIQNKQGETSFDLLVKYFICPIYNQQEKLNYVQELLSNCAVKGILKSPNGNSSLNTLAELAVYHVNEGVLKTLIEGGVNVNCRDENGDTVLHHALKWFDLDEWKDRNFIKFILSKGAKLDIQNKQGETPFDLLVRYAKGVYGIEKTRLSNVVGILNNYTIKGILKSPNVNSLLNTLAKLAFKFSNRKLLNFLIENDIKIPSTILKDIVQRDYENKIFDCFLHKNKINYQDESGNTPLHHALRHLHRYSSRLCKVVELLASGGARFDIENNKGETPFDLLVEYVEEGFYGQARRLSDAWNLLNKYEDKNVLRELKYKDGTPALNKLKELHIKCRNTSIIVASTLAVAGVALGIAIAVYSEMLAVGIAAGACCLVVAGIAYRLNRPVSSFEGNNIQELSNNALVPYKLTKDVAGGITYSVSKPSDKLDKPDLEANQQVNEVC